MRLQLNLKSQDRKYVDDQLNTAESKAAQVARALLRRTRENGFSGGLAGSP